MTTPKRTARWIGPSKKELLDLPKPVRETVGHELWEAQLGHMPAGAKVLQGFKGASVVEIRADHAGNAYRAVYTVRFGDLIYVLLVFQKKSKKGNKTPANIMELIRKRLQSAENDYEEWKTKTESQS